MSAASEIIRASVETLHEDLRWPWAVGGDGHVYAQEPNVDGDFWVAEADTHETAKHIVLLASPHVAEALAELLEAIEEFQGFIRAAGDGGDTERIEQAAAALEAAISREGRSDGA